MKVFGKRNDVGLNKATAASASAVLKGPVKWFRERTNEEETNCCRRTAFGSSVVSPTQSPLSPHPSVSLPECFFFLLLLLVFQRKKETKLGRLRRRRRRRRRLLFGCANGWTHERSQSKWLSFISVRPRSSREQQKAANASSAQK